MNFTKKMNNEDLINKIAQLMQADDSSDAPADAVKWSKNLFRTRIAERKKSVVERVLAVLRFDLTPNQAVFGERSASPSDARQMLFDAGEQKIDLRITKINKGFKINGQIIGGDFAGAQVKLFNDEKSFNAQAGELSEFTFEKISKGQYTLSLIFKDKEIIVETIIFD